MLSNLLEHGFALLWGWFIGLSLLLEVLRDLLRLEASLEVELVLLLGEEDLHAAIIRVYHQLSSLLVDLAYLSHDLSRVSSDPSDILCSLLRGQ